MSISLNKKAVIPAAIVTAIIFVTALLTRSVFFAERFKFDVLLYVSVFLGAVLIGALILCDINIKNEIVQSVTMVVLFLLSPIVTLTMTECLNDVFVYDMTYLGFAGNYIIILMFLGLVYGITGSLRMPLIIVNPILFIFAIINHYVTSFRGTPFIPMDIASVKTGMNVASEYEYKITHQVLVAAVILIFLIVVGIKLKSPQKHKKTRTITRIATVVVIIAIFLIFYFTNLFASFGIVPDFWNQSRGYKRHGFVCSFFINTKYLFVTTPSGYLPGNVESYVSEEIKDFNANVETSTNSKKPNHSENKSPTVICIMNESLSDLSAIGNFETNEDYMPYLRSLKENTIKGSLYVPVIGAGTSNTEYEFLTGNTTAFFPSGSNAYMLYVKNNAYSLVSTLASQYYNCVAFHPYYSSGWNRVNVYNNFGFKLFKSLGNIMNIDFMEEYQSEGNIETLISHVNEAYPGSNMLLRTYVTDSYDYKVLIEDYENRDTSLPYFVFNVTMQNHGGYNIMASNFSESIHLTNLSKDYGKVNQYLSLVKHSDNAFKELLDYFKNVDEPVIICMFGDHQPAVEEKFIEEVMGKKISQLTPEEEQARHKTVFYIWANYDIPEQEIDMMSVNYLSSYLLKTAGLKLTDYNKYLLSLYEKLPVIDTVGYIDRAGNNYTWTDQSEYTELLKEYEYVQYNNVFDILSKKKNLFSLN